MNILETAKDLGQGVYTQAEVDIINTFVSDDDRVKTALNASGTAPIYACRAWVNFNGTGTVAIRASGNVSSITDGGVGRYIANTIIAMQDTSFSYSLTLGGTNSLYSVRGLEEIVPSTVNSLAILCVIGTTATDSEIVNLQIFE